MSAQLQADTREPARSTSRQEPDTREPARGTREPARGTREPDTPAQREDRPPLLRSTRRLAWSTRRASRSEAPTGSWHRGAVAMALEATVRWLDAACRQSWILDGTGNTCLLPSPCTWQRSLPPHREDMAAPVRE
ncbi:PP224 [Orf virus]|uniref:PP224 n=1 Tax=Orf virus TaxID=10258 RepID=F1AX97_ORFV|nr:PP224 [Orf virus]